VITSDVNWHFAKFSCTSDKSNMIINIVFYSTFYSASTQIILWHELGTRSSNATMDDDSALLTGTPCDWLTHYGRRKRLVDWSNELKFCRSFALRWVISRTFFPASLFASRLRKQNPTQHKTRRRLVPAWFCTGLLLTTIVNFSHTNLIYFSANNTSFRWRLDWVCTDTHRHTKVKTVYPPVLLRSLGGYKDTKI